MVQPARLNSTNVRVKLIARETGTRVAAPAEAFQADAVIPAALRSATSTPSTPKAAEDLITAPKFRGSVTPSSATTKGASS